MILLNPGPVSLSPRVRAALSGPDLCHREPEYGALQERVRQGLLQVYSLTNPQWCPVLLTSSGTGALEAMITSLVPREGQLLVLENGVYGERITELARLHGIFCVPLSLAWGEAIETERVADLLAAHPEVRHVAVVHHETTTGRLNDLEGLLRLCEERGARLLLDAVSSFGGEPIPFDSPALAACAATANKCLHGAPGLAFVLVRTEVLRTGVRPARSLYLDLLNAAEHQSRGETAFTPGIPALYALSEALCELSEQGGWHARHARYAQLADQVSRGLENLGFVPFLQARSRDEGHAADARGARHSSVVLRSYRLGDLVSYDDLHAGLRKRGFIIYAGQGLLRSQIFRISTMGCISESDIHDLLAGFHRVMSSRRGDAA